MLIFGHAWNIWVYAMVNLCGTQPCWKTADPSQFLIFNTFGETFMILPFVYYFKEFESHGKFIFKLCQFLHMCALNNPHLMISLEGACSYSIFTCFSCQVKVLLRPQPLLLLIIETNGLNEAGNCDEHINARVCTRTQDMQ